LEKINGKCLVQFSFCALSSWQTRSPAIARKSRPYCLHSKSSLQFTVTERKQFVRGESSMHAMLTQCCLESYNERLSHLVISPSDINR